MSVRALAVVAAMHSARRRGAGAAATGDHVFAVGAALQAANVWRG